MNMHVKRPDLAVDSIPSKLAVQHRRAAKARQRVRKLRQRAFAEIERLIAFLDASDGYTTTELEEGHDAEPSLGFHKHGGGQEVGGSWHDDREAEDEHDEPSLGSCEWHPQPWMAYGGESTQERWSQGNSDEREGDGCADDREGDELQHGGESLHEDDEPSLGWTAEETVRGRYAGSIGQNADCEEDAGDMPEYDPAELGLADMDAVKEQIGQSGGFCYSEVL